MNNRFPQRCRVLAGAITVALLAPATAMAQQAATTASRPATPGIEQEKSFPSIASGKWTGKRLPDGQPDIAGFWSNTIANHNNFTDPQGGIPFTPRKDALGPRESRAPSRVSDPSDGQVPFLPWARAAQKDFSENFNNPIKPQYIEPLARCAPAGVPKSLYWHGYEVRQFPGYVVFLFDSGTRIIHLDGKPHLPENIKLWNADSRGHWEGNTLVVDVTNNNAKALFGRTGEFASENVHITERYIFDKDNQRYNYVATLTDPSVYTRPFTVTVPAKRWSGDGPRSWHYKGVAANHDGKDLKIDVYERICSENNGGFGAIATAPQTKK